MLGRVRLDGIWLGVKDGLLMVEAKEPVGAELVQSIARFYAEAADAAAHEAENEAQRRLAMLQAVTAATGLPLGEAA